MVEEHAIYLALGEMGVDRAEAYKALFKAHVDKQEVTKIGEASHSGTVRRHVLYKEKIEKKMKGITWKLLLK